LLAAPTPAPVATNVNEAQQELARLFRANRSRIELTLSADLQKLGWQTEYLVEANYFFGDEISAALELGDVGFQAADLEWVKRLLAARQVPSGSLNTYLSAYCNALTQVLGEVSDPLADWINTYLLRNSVVS